MRNLWPLLLFLVLPVRADNFDTTWALDTDWAESTVWTDTDVSGLCDTEDTYTIDATNGNPTHNRLRHCVGRNDASVRASVWSGTWEDLGVTAGHTVSTIQMLDLDTKYLTDTVCDEVIFGPFELHASSGGLVNTIWTGRTATTVEAGFTAEGAQTAVGVGALTASDAGVTLYLNGTGDTGNNATATCEGVFDNLDIRVVATGAAAPAANVFRRRVIVSQ